MKLQLQTGTEGVTLAELPLPFPVGPVNCWILVDHPVTVVDPGMLYEDSTDRIEAALAEIGLPLTAVDQIVVTHAHPDSVVDTVTVSPAFTVSSRAE